MGKQTHAFTLIELLVVISIIALLISLLLPALSRAQKEALYLQCKAQLRQFSQANANYAADNDDYVVLPNWGPASQGWLYADESVPGTGWYYMPGSVHNYEKRRDMRMTGHFWEYLGEEGEVYHCPADNGDWKNGSRPCWAMSSYIANGALNGYGRSGTHLFRIEQFRSDAAMFWENDAETGSLGAWHDGANHPIQNGSTGLSTRHGDGAPVALIDGSTTKWTNEEYSAYAQEQSKANPLYCVPDRERGR